jgi:hypothetical protein
LVWGKKLVDLGIGSVPTNAAIFWQGLDDGGPCLVELPLLANILLALGNGLLLGE